MKETLDTFHVRYISCSCNLIFNHSLFQIKVNLIIRFFQWKYFRFFVKNNKLRYMQIVFLQIIFPEQISFETISALPIADVMYRLLRTASLICNSCSISIKLTFEFWSLYTLFIASHRSASIRCAYILQYVH